MTKTLELPTEHLLHIHQEIDIDAPIATVFASGAGRSRPGNFLGGDDKPMNLKLEAWPGGRWYRDLGNNTGHFWGHVQVIKPPKLLELYGPMMMSYAAISHVQYRLTEQGKGTRLSFTHRAIRRDRSQAPRRIVAGLAEDYGKNQREQAEK